MNSRSSASIGSGAHSGDCPSTSSCHQTSRPSCISTPSWAVRRTTRQRSIDGVSAIAASAISLSATTLPAPPRAVAGDEHLALGVVDPVAQRVRGEAAEHHRVRRAEPCAREHRDGELGHHAEVDRDPVALADAQRLERVRGPADVLEQLRVGDLARVAGLTLPEERDLLAVAGLHVTVHAVVRGVQLPADEPLRERQVPLEHGVPGLRPVEELARLGGPEAPAGRRPRRRAPDRR